MTRKLSLVAATIAAGVLCAASQGMATTAGSLGALKGLEQSHSPMAEKTAFRHGCWWGPGGYHKWVPGVGRVQCTAKKCWRNRWGVRRCRWF
ncbi:MAG: hypothetical protein JSS54_03045 [Proteobacteria bacterium]|nr:hypothetical protein [Pseudomonadota bacterium]MBS0267938.1 hypothetical protein [Pseudomonadota bacterium]